MNKYQDFPWYSVTPLAASTTWTGGWKQVKHIPTATHTEIPVIFPWAVYVLGLVYSDATGTLYVDHSNDGSTAHYTESVGVTTGVGYNRTLYGSWIRLRYTNGTVTQASFSISGWLTGEQ